MESRPIIEVHSLNDERLADYRDLTDHPLRTRFEDERALMIVESKMALEVALDEDLECVSLLIDERRLDTCAYLLEHVDPEVPVYVMDHAAMSELVGYKVTRGVLAAFRRKPLLSVAEAIEGARNVCVVEDIVDVSNVGALFRSAAALGVDAVILSPSCTSPLARRAIRVSIGNTFRLPWAQAEPDAWPHATIDALHGAGFACYALALKDDAVSLDDPSLKVPEKRALFFGNEGSGLSRAVLDACDAHVIIPMARGVDSLNVAASSAVAFWELFARDRALNERGPLA